MFVICDTEYDFGFLIQSKGLEIGELFVSCDKII